MNDGSSTALTDLETGEITGQIPNSETYCALVQARVWSNEKDKPSLYERMLAISLDLQRLPKKGTMSLSNRSFAYHNIDDVMSFFAHAQLRYRVFIKTSHTVHDFTPASKPYLVITFSAYNIDQPEEFDNWTWVDDGEDFTKAAAFTLKYGLLRHFHSSDGNDEEYAGESRPGVQSRSASVNQGKAKEKQNNTEPAVRRVDFNDEASRRKTALLSEFNKTLPTPFGDNYVDSMLGLYETRRVGNQLTDSQKEAGSPFAWVYFELAKAHKDNNQCGSNCPHAKEFFDRLKAVS